MAEDVLIAGAIGAAPQSYEVPNAQEIIPKAIRATFNGSGAASAFVPTIRIISDGGVVVAEVATDTQVAAGDSASVTFAPFLRTNQAGGITEIESTDASITVTNPFGPVVDLTGAGGGGGYTPPTTQEFPSAFIHLAANASGNASWSCPTNVLVDYTAPTAPKIKTAGIYALSGYSFNNPGDGITAGNQVQTAISFLLTTTAISEGAFTGSNNPASGVPLAYVIPHSLVAYMPVNTVFTASAFNFDTIAHDFNFAMIIQRIT